MEGASIAVRRDADGYLVDPREWTEEVAVAIAREMGIELGPDHWDVIRFMRRYWEEHQIAADARFVIRHLMERLGPGARNRLFELFPYGYPGQACKIAGMKRPRAWSTGLRPGRVSERIRSLSGNAGSVTNAALRLRPIPEGAAPGRLSSARRPGPPSPRG